MSLQAASAWHEGQRADQLLRTWLTVRRSLRHWWIALVLAALGTIGGGLVARRLKPTFVSETSFLYRDVTQTAALGAVEQERISTQLIGPRLKELLLARPRLHALMAKHGLHGDLLARGATEEAIELFRKNVSFTVQGGDIFRVAYSGPAPQVAQAVTRELAESVIEDDLRLRHEQTTGRMRFLEGERRRAELELRRKEEGVARFLAKHPEFALETQAGSGDGSGGLGASIRVARREQEKGADRTTLALQRQAERIRRQLGGGRASGGREDPQLASVRDAARDELAEAERTLASRRTQFTEMHPDVRAAKARLAAARAAYERVKRAMAAGTKAVLPTASPEELRRQLAQLEEQIAGRKSRTPKSVKAARDDEQVKGIVALEVEWTRLNRDATEARARYALLESSQFRASLAASSDVSGESAQRAIIDGANLPSKPTGLAPKLILALSAAGGFLLGFLIMLGLALVDDRICYRADVSRLELAPLLVAVPRTPLRRKPHAAAPKAARRGGGIGE
ncbi:MAG: hypothetical protein IT371_12335 [Deltaproteobacteria bacterium]|nr:hypothetical protein [Deltaproteobacteria bacterium]